MGLDADPLRLRGRHFRNRHLEHAIQMTRTDVVRFHVFRQREATQEAAFDPLQARHSLLLVRTLELALAGHAQHAFLGRDLDVLRLDTRQIRAYHEAIGLLEHVDRRDPVYSGCAVGRRGVAIRRRGITVATKYLSNLPMEALDRAPGLITYNYHCPSPVGGWCRGPLPGLSCMSMSWWWIAAFQGLPA